MLRRSKIASLAQSIRKLLWLEQLLVTIGAAVYAILRSLDRPSNFFEVLIFSLSIGNIAYPAHRLIRGLYYRKRFPYNWLIFLPLLLGVSTCSIFVADVLDWVWFGKPGISLGTQFRKDLPFVLLITIIVGVVFYLYLGTRSRLENRNLELQQAVRTGMTQLQKQEEELERAREIQEGLLPKSFPLLKGFEIASAWQPARTVGGDYFDFLKFTDKKMGICIGDVAGKGITAALLMSNIQAAARAFGVEPLSTASLCQKLNSVVSNIFAANRLVTFFYCILDGDTLKMIYTNAGHCIPIIFRRSGREAPLDNGGAILGAFPEWQYVDSEVQLEPGDRVLLFTDGITEAMNSSEEEFGEQRLVELVNSNPSLGATELQSKIMHEVTRFCDAKFQDDATLIVIGVT